MSVYECTRELKIIAKEVECLREKLDYNNPDTNGYLRVAVIYTLKKLCKATEEEARKAVNTYVKEG